MSNKFKKTTKLIIAMNELCRTMAPQSSNFPLFANGAPALQIKHTAFARDERFLSAASEISS
jgi:hypothetical protein